MMGLGWQELVIVLIIIMIIFGAGKLPEVAKSLGQGVKEFKQEAAPVGSGDTSTTATAGSESNGVVAAAPVSEAAVTESERTDATRDEATTRSTI